MFNTILNPLSQFEIIDFLYFEASLIDNIHISLAPSSLLGGSPEPSYPSFNKLVCFKTSFEKTRREEGQK